MWYFDINFDCFMALERTIWLSWQLLVVVLWPFGGHHQDRVSELGIFGCQLEFQFEFEFELSSLLGNN